MRIYTYIYMTNEKSIGRAHVTKEMALSISACHELDGLPTWPALPPGFFHSTWHAYDIGLTGQRHAS